MPTSILVLLLTAFVLALLELRVWSMRRRCPLCARRYAVFPVRGRLNRWVLVCSRDWKIHRAHRDTGLHLWPDQYRQTRIRKRS